MSRTKIVSYWQCLSPIFYKITIFLINISGQIILYYLSFCFTSIARINMTLSNIANAENALYQHYSALMFLQNHLVLESCIPNQLGANHVCVRLSRRRDIITSMWYFEIMEWYKVSLLHDSITETWYFTNFKHSKLQKQFEMEYTLLQGSKECTSARYLFLLLSHTRDSSMQTWFDPNWLGIWYTYSARGMVGEKTPAPISLA